LKDARHYEFRGEHGQIILAVDMIEGSAAASADTGMVELAADVGGASYRVRIFPPARRRMIRAAHSLQRPPVACHARKRSGGSRGAAPAFASLSSRSPAPLATSSRIRRRTARSRSSMSSMSSCAPPARAPAPAAELRLGFDPKPSSSCARR
jgi:hypothetical protein